MPRARSLDSETEPVKKVVRRAPRRKVVPEDGLAVAPAAPEVAQAESITPEPEVVERRVRAKRKAPQVVIEEPVVTARRPRQRPYVHYAVVVGIFMVSIGVSAAVGFSDKGTIDVAARISEQNAIQVATDGSNSDGQQTIPVQNSAPPSVPNGGLSGQGVLAVPVAVVAPAATTSTSTVAESASSTPVTEEVSEPTTVEPSEPETEAQSESVPAV